MRGGMIAAVLLLSCVSMLAGQDSEVSNAKSQLQGKISFGGGPADGAAVFLFRSQLLIGQTKSIDGQFEIEFEKVLSLTPDSDKTPALTILAVAKESKFHIQNLASLVKSDFEIQLQPSPAPLAGRVIDNQGMGVADLTIRITTLQHKNETLPLPPTLDREITEVKTDQRGGFQFSGIESAMVGSVSVTGTGIADAALNAASFSNEIVLVAQPGKSVRGKVIDSESGAPVPGVNVRMSSGAKQTRTDETGRFEMTGLSAFQPMVLFADSTGDSPYLWDNKTVPVEQGFDAVEVEIKLTPGIAGSCTVTDFDGDRPAAAQVFYLPTPENEQFQSFAERLFARGFAPPTRTDANGVAKFAAMPGPGYVVVVADGFPSNESVNKLTEQERTMLLQFTRTAQVTAIESISPVASSDEIELSVLVSSGRSIEVELVGDVVGQDDYLIVHRAASETTYSQRVTGNKFSAEQFQPGQSRQVLVHAPGKRLGAVVQIEAEAESPIRLTMEPTGSLVGRIVNKDGDPQPGLLLRFEIADGDGFQEVASEIFTDANGRFEKPSLIASLKYRVSAIRLSKDAGNMRMMSETPKMDSRHYIAEQLQINGEEMVDLGEIVLGEAAQPEPQRMARKGNNGQNDDVESFTMLPSVFAGVITDDEGQPIADARISLNTWPNRTDEIEKRSPIESKPIELKPVVLAQSRTDASGGFQMTIDPGLGERLIGGPDDESPKNAAVVIVAAEKGTVQLPIAKIEQPENLAIQMTREMIVRGKSVSTKASEVVRYTVASPMRVFDVDSINHVVDGLKAGKSLDSLVSGLKPLRTLEPLAGGLPLSWETAAADSFLVRGVPLNAIFELQAEKESGVSKTITVIGRPIRGFEIKAADGRTTQLSGSRIRINFNSQASEATEETED